MSIEMSSDSAICYRCGIKYGKRKGNFPVSYSSTHKGVGYMPICKECAENLYNTYLAQCNDSKLAVRQMCRKFDLYWSESLYDDAINKSSGRTVLSRYLQKLTTNKVAGKCYDDSLSEEGTLWSFSSQQVSTTTVSTPEIRFADSEDTREPIEITDEIIQFWGSGYTPDMYAELEQRRQNWISSLPEGTNVTVGMEAIIRQICNLEIVIAKDSAAGKPIEKSVNSLNTLLGSLNIKPAQLKTDDDKDLDKMPLGVGIHMWEDYRPLPPTPSDQKDVSGRIKDITTWFLGHTCSMLGIRNSYCRMYEEAMQKLRVEYPEYEEDDDNEFLSNVFGSSDTNDVSISEVES